MANQTKMGKISMDAAEAGAYAGIDALPVTMTMTAAPLPNGATYDFVVHFHRLGADAGIRHDELGPGGLQRPGDRASTVGMGGEEDGRSRGGVTGRCPRAPDTEEVFR